MNTDTKQEYLDKTEYNAFVNELSEVITRTVRDTVSLADKHNVDRDNAVEHFASVFSAMQQISTFKEFDSATDTESCEGCRWHTEHRYQRCTCCRRNKNLKDCYSKEATQ